MTCQSEFEALPRFVYHPDAVATGSVIESETTCRACGCARGYIYAGAAYGREDLNDSLCPWCIADGTAHSKFNVEFTDPKEIGGGPWDMVPEAVVDEVAHRTPGFSGWQQERWFSHCGDAAIFLGPMGREELEGFGAEAVRAIMQESGVAENDWGSYLTRMNKNRGPVTAYLFRCRHCGVFGGYSDCH